MGGCGPHRDSQTEFAKKLRDLLLNPDFKRAVGAQNRNLIHLSRLAGRLCMMIPTMGTVKHRGEELQTAIDFVSKQPPATTVSSGNSIDIMPKEVRP